ncbi:hypothetical protein C4D60_Mb00t19990 [Musa balbisiana]|uniref:Uncharacterized protein n=1 Tax=Musa balbisiana TaxID=52838 RepID=A0A4S8I518_MUSBA|nr:hypothetical protein C4D60_Mb00t19990 [Musa balbisiana]
MCKLRKAWLGAESACLRDRCLLSHDFHREGRKREDHTDQERHGSASSHRFAADGANSAEYVRDILISFASCSPRDTTALALTWFFWLLSLATRRGEQNKGICQRIRSRRQPGNRPVRRQWRSLWRR